jgi:hypothetical protein
LQESGIGEAQGRDRMDASPREVVAIIAVVIFLVTLGLILIIAIQPQSGPFAKIAQLFLRMGSGSTGKHI